MGTLVDLVGRVMETLGGLSKVSQQGWTNVRGDEAFQIGMLLLVLVVAMLVTRYVRGGRPGRSNIVVPALPPRPQTGASGLSVAPLRHGAFVLFLTGLPFFFLALAAPETALVQEERTFPGHRITILIDASLSMDTAFSTERLRAGNTFLANVAAAEYFVRRRMEGPYHDLISLIQFGSQAYIVTPFTNDYENVLLSIGLIGTPEEYDRFPDHGTLIMEAINRGVQMFRTFDFLRRSGNLIVIFSDGQDTHARYEDTSLDEILQEASDNSIPVYFIRTSYDQELGDILPRHDVEDGGRAHGWEVLSCGQRRGNPRCHRGDRPPVGGANRDHAVCDTTTTIRSVRVDRDERVDARARARTCHPILPTVPMSMPMRASANGADHDEAETRQ